MIAITDHFRGPFYCWSC